MAYRVFVSHVWRAQHEYYWGLIRLLANAKRFRFVDLSIPKLRPLEGEYIDAKDEILSGLRSADVVLVINTPVLTRSAAVQDELAEAKRCGIPNYCDQTAESAGQGPWFEPRYRRGGVSSELDNTEHC